MTRLWPWGCFVAAMMWQCSESFEMHSYNMDQLSMLLAAAMQSHSWFCNRCGLCCSRRCNRSGDNFVGITGLWTFLCKETFAVTLKISVKGDIIT